MRRGHQGKVDQNQREVIQVAESYGWQVVSLASTKNGVPDLLCYREPHGYLLVEVKAGPKAKLTPAQERFRQKYSMPVLTVRSQADAELVFGAITKD